MEGEKHEQTLRIYCPQCGRTFVEDGLSKYAHGDRHRPSFYQCPICGFHPVQHRGEHSNGTQRAEQ